MNILNWWGDLERWIAYRTYEKYHVIRVHGMKPEYADKDHQMLHAMFGLLVDYVECECGWMQHCSQYRTKHKPHRWFNQLAWRNRLLPWKPFRSSLKGLEHLAWEIGLKNDESCGYSPSDEDYGQPTEQAKAAEEIKSLYFWYTETRPQRIDPDLVYNDSDKSREDVIRAYEAEQAYDRENNEMLKRLVDVRLRLRT